MPDDGLPLVFDMLPFRGVLEKRDGNFSIISSPTFSIIDITQAASGVVQTAVAHGYSTGDQVLISGVGGMTEVNNPAIQPYNITVTAADMFEINVDTTGFGAYTAGGVVSKINYVGPIGIDTIANDAVGTVTTMANHNLTTGQQVFLLNARGTNVVNSETVFYTITVTGAMTFQLNINTTTWTHTQFTGGIFLPIQSLPTRQTSVFFKDLIAFTQNQAYLFDAAINQFNNISGATTWTANDSFFFWWMNYANSFWATNNFDPIRYYISGTTWTDFRPILFGISHTAALGGGIGIGAVAYGPFVVANPPIIPGTVVIQLSGGSTAALNERFTDDGLGVLTGSNGSSGTVVYSTGTIDITTLTPDPTNARTASITYDEEGDRLERALMIFPYKDRMVALNTTQGAGLVNNPIRVTYSQNGTPYVQAPVPSGLTFNAQAWRQDVPGRGGFLDAPTDERIISAGFVRDMLVVLFEFSAWRLRYTANEALPFVWERFNSQYGSESTYSAIGFDAGLLTVGRTGIILSDTNASRRIDEVIPDQVYQISNIDNSQRRVQGIRDFQRQVAYWTYPEAAATHYPNRTLVYNYLEKVWTLYRQMFTCFGQFRRDDTLTWGNAFTPWATEDSLWGAGDLASGFPIVVAGNRLGQVFGLDKRLTTDNDEPFNFLFFTKKFNPFFSQGQQCRSIYMYLLLAGTQSGEFIINHYVDENTSVPISTYTVSTGSLSGQEKVWRRVQLTAATAQYHQFEFRFSDSQFADAAISQQDIELFQIILEVEPAGRLNYGDLR